MEIKKFENILIAFDFESDLVNATDIVKKYSGKRVNDFLNVPSTKVYIESLLDILNTNNNGIKGQLTENDIIVTKKGRNGGTWMNRLLAYELAKWIEPKLAVFVNMVFDSHLKSKLENQQRQLDYFWDKSDQNDIYKR